MKQRPIAGTVKLAAPDKEDMARHLRDLRLRCRFSMRELARQADVAPSYVSGVERGRISPTIATMRKILNAMGSDLGDFFASAPVQHDGCVFRREAMRSTAEKKRCYTFILPRRKDIKLEMIEEEYLAGEKPEFEKINADMAGYVISGEFLLEIRAEPPRALRTGDAFYVPAGTPVRGRCVKGKTARLITVQVPPNYWTDGLRNFTATAREVAKGKEAILMELKKVTPLIRNGGYIPKIDHSVSSDISKEPPYFVVVD